MILVGSRYENSSIDRVHVGNGVYSLVVVQAPLNVSGRRFTTISVGAGDRFDTIAHRLWGDASRWWILADVNPEVDFPGGALVPGSLLRVPLN